MLYENLDQLSNFLSVERNTTSFGKMLIRDEKILNTFLGKYIFIYDNKIGIKAF